MLNSKKNRAGFTLIELLVVVIIVAVLAAVAVPLLSANIDRARYSEAEAGLGTIRSGLRGYLAEHQGYPGTSGSPTGLTLSQFTGVKAGDLNGRFFDDDDFSYTAKNVTNGVAANFCLSVTGNNSGSAPKRAQVNGFTRSMDDAGNLFSDASCTAASQLN